MAELREFLSDLPPRSAEIGLSAFGAGLLLPPAIITKNKTAAISGRGCLVCMRRLFPDEGYFRKMK